MNNRVIFSRNSDEWSTPQHVYDALNEEFHFTLDACATDENHKHERYYTKEQNALQMDWGGETVFCNPPYSKISDWVKKAYYEAQTDDTIVVLLVPSRTDTRWFQNYVYNRSEVRFVEGRLKFNNSKYNAPFPSMIVIFRGAKTKQ